MTNNEIKLMKIPIEALTCREVNAKIHTPAQIQEIKNSINEYGMNQIINVWNGEHNGNTYNNLIIAGEGKYFACKELGFAEILCKDISYLDYKQAHEYALKDNATQMMTGFDLEVLKVESENLDIDFNKFGFDFDLSANVPHIEIEDDDVVPDVLQNLVEVKRGDVFEIGRHRLIYGDSTDRNDIAKLMDGKQANMVFTDPPYNLDINDLYRQGGSPQKMYKYKNSNYDNFEMAGGEFTDEEFIEFLNKIIQNLYDYSVNNSIHYICMDWRHALHLLTPASKIYDKYKAMCVWRKTAANVSSFYRQQHELVFVFQKGKGSYTCNFSFKNYRTNVWDHHSQSFFYFERNEGIERVHPTMKPLQLIADAIQDCSNENDIILDLFGGSGSTMVAAHQTNRTGYLCELSPKYINVIIRRMLQADNTLKVICDGKDMTDVFYVAKTVNTDKPAIKHKSLDAKINLYTGEVTIKSEPVPYLRDMIEDAGLSHIVYQRQGSIVGFNIYDDRLPSVKEGRK
jgi:DNA modification methylase